MMQKIKLDNGCTHLQISEVSTNLNNDYQLRYLYRCRLTGKILDFGIFNCHKCKNYKENNNA